MLEVKFAQRLKEVRLENGLKQTDIAKHLHVTKSTVYRWEAGDVEPDYLTLVILADYLKVSAGYLLGSED